MQFRTIAMALLLAGCSAATGATSDTPLVVKLTLDEAAKAALIRSNEQVKIVAYYYWRTNSGEGPSHEENEFGYVLGGYPVGIESHEIAGQARVHFSGRTEPSAHIVPGEGELRALINVFSARRTHRNNILSCNPVDDSLSTLSARGAAVECSLLP